MKISKKKMVIYFALLLTLAAFIEGKKESVRKERIQKVESILSHLITNGVPVKVKRMEKGAFNIGLNVTLQKCSISQYCFYVSQKDLKGMKVGLSVYRPKSKKPIGSLSYVSRAPDISNGLYRVNVEVTEKNFREGRDGPYIVGEVHLKELSSTFTVPQVALIHESGQNYVWKISGNEASRVSVEIGSENSREVEILKGINEGDVIVVEGMSFLSKYEKFKIINGGKS